MRLRKRHKITFAALRSLRQSPAARGVSRPRARFAFQLLKRVKVKGGHDKRPTVAPMYGRQFEMFLAVSS